MTLLPLLLAAHLIADWIVQTDYQAANKGKEFKAMFGHMLGYHLVLGMAVGAAGVGDWQSLVIFVVSLSTHWFIDLRWPVVWLLEHTRSPNFAKQMWGVMVVDQALHISILCLLAAAFG